MPRFRNFTAAKYELHQYLLQFNGYAFEFLRKSAPQQVIVMHENWRQIRESGQIQTAFSFPHTSFIAIFAYAQKQKVKLEKLHKETHAMNEMIGMIGCLSPSNANILEERQMSQ